jgi:hypothetical protein
LMSRAVALEGFKILEGLVTAVRAFEVPTLLVRIDQEPIITEKHPLCPLSSLQPTAGELLTVPRVATLLRAL